MFMYGEIEDPYFLVVESPLTNNIWKCVDLSVYLFRNKKLCLDTLSLDQTVFMVSGCNLALR